MIAAVLLALLAATAVPLADADVQQGIQWELYADGTLEISGAGAMPDYDQSDAPWKEHAGEVRRIIIGDLVTSIGAGAFADMEKCTSLTVGRSVTSIGDGAFDGCVRLVEVLNESPLTLVKGSGSFGGAAAHAIRLENQSMTRLVPVEGGGLLFQLLPDDSGSSEFGGSRVFESFEFVVENGSTTLNGQQVEVSYNFWCANMDGINISRTYNGKFQLYDGTDNHTFDSATVILEDGILSWTGTSGTPTSDSSTESGTAEVGVMFGNIPPYDIFDTGSPAVWGPDGYAVINYWHDDNDYYDIVYHGTELIYPESLPAGVEVTVDQNGASTFEFDVTSHEWYVQVTPYVDPSAVPTVRGELVGVVGNPTSITSPSEIIIDGKRLSWGVGSHAFEGNKTLRSVSLPGAEYVKGGAFEKCAKLTSISIPDATAIGDWTFAECPSLRTVTLADEVDEMGLRVFSRCTSLESVAIPDGVEYLGFAMFYECFNLTSVSLPDSIIEIGDEAFYRCHKLASLELPEGLETIGYTQPSGDPGRSLPYASGSVFEDCWSLASVNLPDGLTTIGDSAFKNCRSLTSVEIPASAFPLGMGAFSGCTGLTSLEIPEGASGLSPSAFYGCTGLTSVSLPGSLRVIGDSAFYGCTGLTSLEIPDGVTTIDQTAFLGCTHLVSVRLPSTLTTIGSGAFAECYQLYEIRNGSNITLSPGGSGNGGISARALFILAGDAASNLKTAVVDGVEYRMYDCGNDGWKMMSASPVTAIMQLPCPVTVDGTQVTAYSIAEYAFNGCGIPYFGSAPQDPLDITRPYDQCLVSVAIPAGVTAIGTCAFSDNWSLKHIEIPSTVISIQPDAFDTGFAHDVLDESGHYQDGSAHSRDNVYNGSSGTTSFHLVQVGGVTYGFLKDKDGMWGLAYASDVGADLTLPAGLSIGGETVGPYLVSSGLFANRLDLETVTIPANGAFVLSHSVFSGCLNLTSVSSAGLVTSTYYDFADCVSLEEVVNVMPGTYTFADCVSLEEADLTPPENAVPMVNQIMEGAFYNCVKLTSVTLPGGITAIGNYAFTNCVSLAGITIPEGVTSIGDGAFQYCDSMERVDLPDSVASIGERAFAETGLRTLTLPANEQFHGGDYAFEKCAKLASLVVPEGVKELPANGFNGCTSLASVKIPSTMTDVHSAFDNTHIYELSNLSSLASRNIFMDNGNTASAYNDDGTTCLREVVLGDVTYVFAVNPAAGRGADDHYVLVSASGTGKMLALPESFEIDGETVDSYEIRKYAFNYQDDRSLVSVTIPSSVTAIGDNAFIGNIQEVWNESELRNLTAGSRENGYVAYGAAYVLKPALSQTQGYAPAPGDDYSQEQHVAEGVYVDTLMDCDGGNYLVLVEADDDAVALPMALRPLPEGRMTRNAAYSVAPNAGLGLGSVTELDIPATASVMAGAFPGLTFYDNPGSESALGDEELPGYTYFGSGNGVLYRNPSTTATVTFMNGDAEVDVQTIEWAPDKPDVEIELPTAAKDGYHLTGWLYNSEVLTGETAVIDVSSGAVTLYAQWARNTSTVTADGIVDRTVQAAIRAGTEGTITAAVVLDPATAGDLPAMTVGAVSEGLTASVSGDVLRFSAQSPGNYSFTVSAPLQGYETVPMIVEVIVNAPYAHTVTFINSVGGGEFENTRIVVLSDGDGPADVNVVFPQVSQTGYTLEKWTLNGETVDHTRPLTVSVSADSVVSFVSHWTRNTVSIQPFQFTGMNVGEQRTIPLTAVYDPAGGPVATFSVTGATPGLTAVISDGALVLEAQTAGSYLITVSASAQGYQSVPYPVSVDVSAAPTFDHRITYVDGEETVKVQRLVTSASGAAEMTVAQPDLSKEGYHLAGWAYEDGGKAEVHDGDRISVGTSGVTLHAVWEEDKPCDWIPWVLIVVGVLLALLGFFRCFPLLIPVGLASGALGVLELLGVTNFF